MTQSTGLLQKETHQPTLQFQCFKTMAYGRRMLAITVLVIVGIAVQVATIHPFYGIPFLIAATLLSWVVGFDNKLDHRSLKHDIAWEGVPFDRVEEIQKLNRRMGSWDFSLVDMSNFPGGCMFFIAALLATVLSIYAGEHYGLWVGCIIWVDAIILFLPQWFTGMRTLFKQDDLLIKANHITEMLRPVRSSINEIGELRAQIQTAGKSEARVPTDVKISVRFEGAPEHFLGVQAQVVLNRVQGTPYPYLYAVIVSRVGHGLLKNAKRAGTGSPSTKIILEEKVQDDVEISIVRQSTTRTSGYHTKAKVSREIFQCALRIASKHLEAQA